MTGASPTTRDELPGDELLPRADRTTTRAITIAAPPHEVWPWLAQMGQGRGGLYSYDFLENLIGCDIHSADHIVEEWQHVTVGDPFRLHPDVALDVVVVEPNHALVVRGGVPMGDAAPPYDFTWAFVLDELARRQHPSRHPRALRLHAVVGRAHRRAGCRGQLRDDPKDAPRHPRPCRARTNGVARSPATTPSDRRDAGLSVRASTSTGCRWEPVRTWCDSADERSRRSTARRQHRRPRDLYHSALEVVTPERSVHHRDDADPGPRRPRSRRRRRRCRRYRVGPIAARLPLRDPPLARWRHPRRCVCDRQPRAGCRTTRLSPDRVLERALSIPTPVWGRDEQHAGEMWNSNSVTSWLLTRSGIDIDDLRPPRNGRAPGWDAGRVAGRVEPDDVDDADDEPAAAGRPSGGSRPLLPAGQPRA